MAQHRTQTTKAVIFDLGGVVVPSPLAAFLGKIDKGTQIVMK